MSCVTCVEDLELCAQDEPSAELEKGTNLRSGESDAAVGWKNNGACPNDPTAIGNLILNWVEQNVNKQRKGNEIMK